MATKALLIAFLLNLLLFASPVTSWVCLTNQNPYCKGNSRFQSLCCNYPDVCYWSDRYQTPSCCPAGQDCSEGNGGGPTTLYTGPVYGTITTTWGNGQQNTAPAQPGTTVVQVISGTEASTVKPLWLFSIIHLASLTAVIALWLHL